MIWISSDWHWGHFNVIRYCNRPYTTTMEMNQAIVDQCNKQVKEDDTLYILGDVAVNPEMVEIYLPKIKCKNIHLIAGNHDPVFIRPDTKNVAKREQMIRRYLRAGFKSVQQELWITISKPRKGILGLLGFKKKYKVQMSHFPFAPKTNDKSNGDTRYLNCRPIDQGQILLAGHSHSYYRKNGRQIDVGFDGDLKLFSEYDIIDLIEDPREYIPSPITEYYKNRKDYLIKDTTNE